MKKHRLTILLLLFTLLLPITASAKPTNAEIDLQARNFNACVTSCGNTVYYISEGALYSASSNGKNHKKVAQLAKLKAGEIASSLQSYDKTLYYLLHTPKDTSLYRYTPGGKPEIAQTNVRQYIIGGDTLFYGVPSQRYIKTINMKTGKKGILLEEKKGYALQPVKVIENVLILSKEKATGFDGNYEMVLHSLKTGNTAYYYDQIPYYDQTRGNYIYTPSHNRLERYTFDQDIPRFEGSPKTLFTLKEGDYLFLSGDYAYYSISRISAGKAYLDFYQRSFANGKAKKILSSQDTETLQLQPCGKALWLFDINAQSGPKYIAYASKP